jgi:hypothetical protein
MSRDGLPARKVAIAIHSGGEPMKLCFRREVLRYEDRLNLIGT